MTINTYDSSDRKRANDNTIYYFTTHDYAISNIRNSRIKISNFESVNDIFELKAIDHTYADDIHNKGLTLGVKNLSKRLGFLSFSKFWDSPLMWGHYSKNTGICLGYKIIGKNITPREITYSNKKESMVSLVGNMLSSTVDEEKFLNYLYKKSYDWVYEQEVRIITEFKNKDPETGLYFFPTSKKLKLTEIILGPKSGYIPNDIKTYLDLNQIPGEITIFKAKPSDSHLFLMDEDTKYMKVQHKYKTPDI